MARISDCLSNLEILDHRGYRLDISWSQVQKSNVDEIQRGERAPDFLDVGRERDVDVPLSGRMTNRQRFLPPPIAPTIADYRLPFSFSHARPHTGVQERSPYGEAMRPWDEMSVGGSSEGDRPKRILGRVVVMVDLVGLEGLSDELLIPTTASTRRTQLTLMTSSLSFTKPQRSGRSLTPATCLNLLTRIYSHPRQEARLDLGWYDTSLLLVPIPLLTLWPSRSFVRRS